ncbi:hypothetical protein E2C01_089119 [Portunus trituberculatus]|uniref:Uncharacterized protein n=1 Tax=Portunus trituberculatus TaxID=210409 RepID=A0A5B7JB41_PORTR|nr:hypothetical protein [Portunus trituberculatus]
MVQGGDGGGTCVGLAGDPSASVSIRLPSTIVTLVSLPVVAWTQGRGGWPGTCCGDGTLEINLQMLTQFTGFSGGARLRGVRERRLVTPVSPRQM